MKVFSIHDIPDFSNKGHIVVVGIVGKSPQNYPNKTSPLLSSVACEDNGIECHWDERKSILYLHAITYLDTNRLLQLATNLDEQSKSSVPDADAAHWLVASGELAVDACKTMALLFHLCHIVILSSPTSVFDMGYLQLFKAIDAYRNELTGQTTTALLDAGLSGSWETHGRTCCPRLLFHFRRAPAPLRQNPAALKRLEHAVEDQIYFILRKARIITNVCAKSLFAIPKNEEFVYISAEENNGNARDMSSLVRGLVQLCSGIEPETTARQSFRQFLQTHLDLAFGEGFDDNVGKYAMSTSFFELPNVSSWCAAARALVPVYLKDSAQLENEIDVGGALFDALATDVRFSQARCAKVLPIAQASYAEGLPSHYSSQHHAHKVSVALGVVEAMARGPLAGGARARLRAACAATWRTRRLCEAPSLTSHPCVNPEHDGSKEHSSGVRYVSACNCGRSKCSRDDPYSVRAANCAFYSLAADECGVCPTLTAIAFPVFQPSTPTFRAASVKGSAEENQDQERCEGSVESAGSPARSGGWSPHDELSPGSEKEDTQELGEAIDVVPVSEEITSAKESTLSRQPSTTEYLPGMLHLDSPAHLLPAFPSWSLVCLGPSSLYSHSMGLPEHLQPGFLPHTNYLLPWDCSLRIMESSSNVWRGSARGRVRPGSTITVKIFIGFEYECPRGHRFMMSSPDTVMNGGSGWGREGSGAKLALSEMPLYWACLCRPSAMLAQLTRLHVVTPKTNVNVTLEPRVQPVPGGPVFIPQSSEEGPIKLTASTYWILRLPYIYADERGPIQRPRTSPAPGSILPPIFGLQE
ncbi:nonsense-mediated mRNA decay factor SMG8 [Leptidea sinapis]|uniref:nonsense-mediated mRNA decay factor SMG8 n=1 Tax=Leptidea sinapis TaxID=189913 RepID=UPI002137B27D|nr:nonsense-mediated mRNA decay factor SMG8 [Leptidea sinapis]